MTTGYLTRPLTKALSPTAGKKLATLGLETVEDLLWHIPHRYQDPGELTNLAAAELDTPVVLSARVVDTQAIPMRRRHGTVFKAIITDGTSQAHATFFLMRRSLVDYYRRLLRPGTSAVFSGKLSLDRGGALQLVHPSLAIFDDDDAERSALADAQRLVPVYRMSAQTMGPLIGRSVEAVLGGADTRDIPDFVPAEIRAERGMPHLYETFRAIHLLDADADHQRARRDLKFTEAFLWQVRLRQHRHLVQQTSTTARPGRAGGALARFDAALPFPLTAGQRAVGDAIARDLASDVPMMRLLQGDVGSGKTLVALRAMLQVVDAGGQAALLAPTEVLAYQHYRTISDMLGSAAHCSLFAGPGTLLEADEGETEAGRVGVTLVTGSQKTAERRRTRAEVVSGQAGIVVGTHALFSEDVAFADLGLVVVDEQHRFGVEQRDYLRNTPAGAVHMLHMTATPIPRTIALTIFGDLEVSELTELPRGRQPVQTFRVSEANELWMRRMFARCAEEIAAGGRVFVVCPRIDMTDDDADRPLHSVQDMVELLAAEPALGAYPVGTLHGRMKPEEKDAAMAAFREGRTPLLVSTTVIEVGVDIPDATVMMIWDADRFGLAQLHQLRGRIGRGTKPGICFAIDPGLPEGTPTQQRLDAFAATTDGFRLAQEDLLLRREGDVVGANQSGYRTGLRVLSAVHDAALIEQARAAAEQVVAADVALAGHPALASAIATLDAEFAERT
ncbi:MAG: ATP-dependent DNA helicase RecG [Bowdeniella nasicola]|nr:ATP-dependent DNA helicase RecG [Bowdeniella nasicola]